MAVSFEQSYYSVDEGDTVDVTVTLSEDPERTVTVPLTKTEQDGTPITPASAASDVRSGETPAATFRPPPTATIDDGESVKLTFAEHATRRSVRWDHQ